MRDETHAISHRAKMRDRSSRCELSSGKSGSNMQKQKSGQSVKRQAYRQPTSAHIAERIMYVRSIVCACRSSFAGFSSLMHSDGRQNPSPRVHTGRRGAARRRDGRVWRLHARVRVRVIDDVDLAAWGQVRRYLSHVARPRRVTEPRRRMITSCSSACAFERVQVPQSSPRALSTRANKPAALRPRRSQPDAAFLPCWRPRRRARSLARARSRHKASDTSFGDNLALDRRIRWLVSRLPSARCPPKIG